MKKGETILLNERDIMLMAKRVLREISDDDEPWYNKHPEYIYHTVLDRHDIGTDAVIKSVVAKGLVPNNNGEIGGAIWFNPHNHEYSGNGKMTLRLKMTPENIRDFEISGDGGTFWAHKTIPFDRLEIVDCPVMLIGNYFFNFSRFTHDRLRKRYTEESGCSTMAEFFCEKSTTRPSLVYVDVWDKFVEPTSKVFEKYPDIKLDKLIS